jgi:hypothetical protein
VVFPETPLLHELFDIRQLATSLRRLEVEDFDLDKPHSSQEIFAASQQTLVGFLARIAAYIRLETLKYLRVWFYPYYPQAELCVEAGFLPGVGTHMDYTTHLHQEFVRLVDSGLLNPLLKSPDQTSKNVSFHYLMRLVRDIITATSARMAS